MPIGLRPGTWGAWVVAVLALLAVTAGAPGCSSTPDTSGLQERTSGDSVVVEVNSKAPAFATRTLDGGTVRLADYVGTHVVLLEFWSIFCKSCIEEMPHIEALHERYAADGLAVLSVNTDVFSAKKIATFMGKAGIHPPYPVLRDQRQEVAGAFGVELLPVTVIVDRDGWIRLYQEGYRPGDERGFESTVRRLLGHGGGDDVTLGARDGVTAFAPAGSALAAVGQKFPDLTARAMDGTGVRVGGGKPQLAYFWSLYCNPCRAEFPAVAALAARYRKRGLGVAAVNVDSVRLAQRVERFVAPHGGLPSVLDGEAGEGAGWSHVLGVRVTPTLVLFDGRGAITYAVSGHMDQGALEAEIQRLLAGDGL
ncbi:MAG: TlpA disulfide reductase family protein [Deferrisomatales bacterium]|nr:TlpA disulfide reductase family protein [Deferrisomatales bacterium]